MRPLRWLAALGVLFLGILGVSFLQKKFDEGDKRKAIAAVQLKRHELAFSSSAHCHAEILSRIHGRVEVQCGEGNWVVDVVRGIIEKQRP